MCEVQSTRRCSIWSETCQFFSCVKFGPHEDVQYGRKLVNFFLVWSSVHMKTFNMVENLSKPKHKFQISCKNYEFLEFSGQYCMNHQKSLITVQMMSDNWDMNRSIQLFWNFLWVLKLYHKLSLTAACAIFLSLCTVAMSFKY